MREEKGGGRRDEEGVRGECRLKRSDRRRSGSPGCAVRSPPGCRRTTDAAGARPRSPSELLPGRAPHLSPVPWALAALERLLVVVEVSRAGVLARGAGPGQLPLAALRALRRHAQRLALGHAVHELVLAPALR